MVARDAWTLERTQELMTLWNADWSSQQICQRFGISRSAVVGKIHRLRQKGHVLREERVTDAVRAAYQRRRAKLAHRHKLKTLGVRPGVPTASGRPKSTRRHFLDQLLKEAADAPKPVQEVGVPKITSILDLEEVHCRWVIHHATGNGWCGEDRVGGLPYCRQHASRAYAPPEAARHKMSTAAPMSGLRLLEEA